MLVLATIAPLLLVLAVLAAVCDRFGPPDPVYEAVEDPADSPSRVRAA